MWPFASDDIVIEEVRSIDAAALADIHRDSFSHGWSAEEFVRLANSDNVHALQCRRPATLFRSVSQAPKGFVLARVAADEAEVLTIAVSQDARGFGLGKALMSALMSNLYADRIENLFLEVDENNTAAIALYHTLRFEKVGERQSYYAASMNDGDTAPRRSRALVMRCDLR